MNSTKKTENRFSVYFLYGPHDGETETVTRDSISVGDVLVMWSSHTSYTVVKYDGKRWVAIWDLFTGERKV